MIAKQYISADEYLRDTWRLAASIRRSGWRPDVLLALWRGGAPVGVAVHEFLKVAGWPTDHMPVKCGSYVGIGASTGRVTFFGGDAVFAALRPGQKVLVVDDVFDSGRTAAAAKAKLDALGVESRLACVYVKPRNNVTTLAPDYVVKDVGEEWIVFPHEIEGLAADEVGRKDALLADLLASFEK